MYCFTDDKCKAVETELQDLVIQLDGTNYSVPPYGYLVENYQSHKCAIAVSYLGILQDSYVLGDAFIKNFYSSFDYQNLTISLAQNSNGPVSFQPALTWGAWLGISIAGVVFIALVVLGVLYFRGRGKKANESEDLLEEQHRGTIEYLERESSDPDVNMTT